MSRRIDPATRPAALGVAAMLALATLGCASAASAADRSPHLQAAQAATAAPPPGGAPDQPLARLKAQLGITPAQEPKFDAFVAVLRQNEAARDAFLRRNPPTRPRNALDQLRVETQAAEVGARGLQRLLPLFQAFYASLSEPQKRTADRAFSTPAQPNEPATR
jgi:periplasmic protein CpxP/Spy